VDIADLDNQEASEHVARRWVVEPVRKSWSYSSYFSHTAFEAIHPTLQEANDYLRQADIGKHAFFDLASKDRSALRIWATQEAVITGPFSQLLLLVAARLTNVHLRGGLVEVIRGEHNSLKDGKAEHSHPWLLHRLCVSLDVDPAEVVPLPPTLDFLGVLADSATNVMMALGALGVGNERMLIPEYSAVRRCFDQCFPEADYEGFLMANISEDSEHSAIIEQMANTLINSGMDPDDYLRGAIRGVDARITYYDTLLEHARANSSR
jgi:hypothetical protein